MPEIYDVIVLGVGGFGSAALDHLARRGVRALGIERFDVAHDRGSSHGETRIIRKAYFEHPDYVPLLLRAYDLWHELQDDAGRELYDLCGLMLAGPPDGEAIAGAKLAARTHRLALEELELAAARARFPGFRFPDDFGVVFEADAGYLRVEECVRAHVERAMSNGAVVKTGESVLGWSSDGRTVEVQTDRERYQAARLVVTAGAWARELLAGLAIPLEVVRKPQFWFEVETADYRAAAGKPAYFFDTPTGQFYGFPSLDGRTVKVAEHSGGNAVADPLKVDRVLHESDVRQLHDFLTRFMPGVKPTPVRHSVCMYTLTPDRHFIIDVHPAYENVAIGAGFSGHGFKFTPVLGAALGDLALDGRTELPIGFLALDRPALKSSKISLS
ncbi:MAG: N-methyl-L-tryptophan oxidase [Planctomycetaceae bacterium]